MRRHQSDPGLRLQLHSSSETPIPAGLALPELLAPDHTDGIEKANVSLTLGQVADWFKQAISLYQYRVTVPVIPVPCYFFLRLHMYALLASLSSCPRAPQGLSWDRFGLGPLPRLVQLVGLKFDESTLAKADVVALASSLKQLTGLKRLMLSSEPLEPYQASALSSSLSGLVSLEHLIIEEVCLEAAQVAMMLHGLTALQHLDLSSDAFSCSAEHIAPALATLTALTHLDLAENNLWKADQDLTAIASILSPFTCLSYLDLGIYQHDTSVNFTPGDVAMAALGHSLPPSLTFLSLAGNEFGANAILAMVPGLQRLTALETLCLSDSLVGGNNSEADRAGCLQALAGCLQSLSSLTFLDLRSNHLGAGSALALAGCLQHMPNIRFLDLSRNRLGAGGVQQLAANLRCPPNLRALFLSLNSIGDDGVAGIAGSLMGLPCLTELDIGRNKLTTAALCSLKAALVALSSDGRKIMIALEVFNLSGNDLGGLRSADSARALISCLEHMPRLQTLNLGSNDLRDSGAKQLAIGLQRMPNLQQLQLNV